MLAYLFWHVPSPGVDLDAYEAGLAVFHQSLGPGEINGFHGSAAFVVVGASWMSGPIVYEDWYLIEDFTGLGELNTAGVRGPGAAPHRVVAGMAAKGAGGVYLLRQGDESVPDIGEAAWFAKPASLSYGTLFETIGAQPTVWQRQLVLGPTPEFCLLGEDSPFDGAIAEVRTRRVAKS